MGQRYTSYSGGFTLIELSIVLVIIGLVVGGVLVGQDLIRSAGVRAQITQIEKYQTAVNTFRGKFNALPGDMNASLARQFGFAVRGLYAGEGDGNGVIEGIFSDGPGWNWGTCAGGETAMVWVDLSQAFMIEGRFSTASATDPAYGTKGTALPYWLPQAKIGQGNYVYVYSGGVSNSDSRNYFGLSGGDMMFTGVGLISYPALSVRQAYGIDAKTDDGLPQSGSVTATYATFGFAGAAGTGATSATALSCYDNGNLAGAVQRYSVSTNGGAGVNCALSFQFQ